MKFFNILFSVVIFALYSQNCNAQKGLVSYGEVQSMGMGAPVGADYNAILIFDKSESLYIVRQDSIEGGNINELKVFSNGDNSFYQTYVTNPEGFKYHYNRTTDTLKSRDLGFRYVKEKAQKIDWDITSDTKDIGGYRCVKANSKFRGRNYTAWFAPNIPLPYGPWKLQNLPGLILEAYDTNKEIYWYFKSIEYPTNYDYLLKPITKPNHKKWLSGQEYKDGLIAAHRDAQVMGRMGAESAGISLNDTEFSMLNTYIEGFSDKKKK